MVIIFRALWVKRGSISRWMILWMFLCLYVAISVIIKDLYAQSQLIFCISRRPSATFPHHSLKTVAHFLGLRQYIGEKKSYKYIYLACKMITLPPFSLVVKKRVALFRKLGVIRHGLQSGENLLEHWPFLNWQKKENLLCIWFQWKCIYMLGLHANVALWITHFWLGCPTLSHELSKAGRTATGNG